ncbi:recQ [Mytilus coruscus]|uniref:DNA 3'-5' helicase n=1 Tax=Mytilus coruscus TaxID=42192 RepID=A0A6J8BZW6_MYTCO|nr:recQ [Mytilus coruscus]
MDAIRAKEKFNSLKSEYNMKFEVKDEQIEVALAVINGRNVLGLLPTGYGKTLCIVLSTILSDESMITLVVSPLTSLIDDQISSLRGFNFRCTKIGSDTDKDDILGIKEGLFSFVFSSPESALMPQWRSVFMSDSWQKKLKLIAIDEAHCVSEWGESFRKEYQRLFELRSFFDVPVMALTATSTKEVKADIFKYLQLSDECTDIVFKSPDRANIYIYNSIKESIDRVSEIFCTLKDCLGLKAYIDGIKDPNNILIEMFHKSTHQDSKDRILKEFKLKESRIRCVIATVALGMGLDIRDVDLVVHIGCPKSVLSYWQEAGRCARDGRQGLSLIIYDMFTVSLKNTAKDIAKIVQNKDNTCIRTQVLSLLSDQKTVASLSVSNICSGCDLQHCDCSYCRCCSVCIEKCPCQKRCFFNVQIFLNQEHEDDKN